MMSSALPKSWFSPTLAPNSARYQTRCVKTKYWSIWSASLKVSQTAEVHMQASAGNRVLMLLENNPFPQDPRPRREARALLDAGFQVSIICPSVSNQPWRECVEGGNGYR